MPDEHVDTLLWAATQASSAHNSQPWELVVVRSPAARAAIAAEIAAAVRASDPMPVPESDADVRIEVGVRNLFATMQDAPLLIFVCARDSYLDSAPQERFLWSAVGAATQNLLVAARSLGLGVAPTMFHVLAEPPIRRLLELPDDVVIGVTAVVGWPARSFGPLQRRPLADVVHRERW